MQQLQQVANTAKLDTLATQYAIDLVKKLKSNLLMVSTIGSANLVEDFIPGLSDIDFIIILEKTDFLSLNTIFDITTNHQETSKILLDVRVYSKYEAESIVKIGALDALNPWIESRIKEGRFKTYFRKGDYALPTINKRKEGLVLSMQFFMNKLRRYLHTRGFYLRGANVMPTDAELKKTVIGSCFCISKFYLEMHGIRAVTQKEIINQMKKITKSDTLVHMYTLKRTEGKIGLDVIEEAYDFCSKLYDESILRI
jgi:hypothetical protein